MTEFALVLPILAFLLFAVIQFGIVLNHYVTLTDAVRAGARKATVSRSAPNPAGAAEDATRRAATDLDPAKLNVTVTSTWAPASDVTVRATYPYQINVLGMVVKSGTLTSTMTERVER
jgi:Flp pilus assembly protein TadG